MNQFRRQLVSDRFFRRTMSFLAPRKKFWKRVEVAQFVDENSSGYLVQLDNKSIKTPLLNKLHAPNEQIAQIMAQEWYNQDEQINPHSMPVTTICNTTIDNPTGISKEELIDALLEFFHTDTIVCLADDPEKLVEYQEQLWSPIHRWFEDKFKVEVYSSANLFTLSQSDEALETMRAHLHTYNIWQLYGLQTSIDAIKSFILPLAVIYGRITVEEAVRLSRLEINFQTLRWGNVEYAHDIEEQNQKAILSAGLLVHKLAEGLEET